MNNLTIKNNEKDYMFIKCGDSVYLIDTGDIVEIINMPRLEYPQRLPKYISGLFDYRGRIINTIDLRNILGLEVKQYNKDTSVIIIEDKNTNDVFALAFDSIEKIEKIDSMLMKPALNENSLSFIRGFYSPSEGLNAVVLDINKILRRIGEVFKNNEMSDIGSIIPTGDFEILDKRSLNYKVVKNELPSLKVQMENEYITFRAGKTSYCVHNRYIKSFYNLREEKITYIPSPKDFIIGILNIKGEYISIIDINRFLEREKTDVNSKSTILVIDSPEFKLGILADSVGNSINLENFENQNGDFANYVEGENVYSVLNIESILNNEKLYLK